MVEEHGLVVREEVPKEVVQAGRAAAQELTKIVGSREKKLLLGGKQYLFFEDWQTIGKFYGVTARIESTEELREAISEELIGFIAHAVALHNGEIVSGADAECTRDEPKWAQKPRFQLRSMAQTRACAKALRNCLGWVAVLAGYEATPAEELEGQSEVDRPSARKPQSMGQPKAGELTRGGMLTTVEGHLESLYGKKNMTDERKAWMADITSDYRGVSLLGETELPQAYRKALEEIAVSDPDPNIPH